MAAAPHGRRARFGAYLVDFRSEEIFKHGVRIKLQDQPFQILATLLETPGELVTRDELRHKLWSQDTFVDFDAGLNAAIRKLRDALNERADAPRYIETLPRHGYRFIASVETDQAETKEAATFLPAATEATPIHLPPFPVVIVPLDAHEVERPSVWTAARSRLFASLMLVAAIALAVASMTNWRSQFFSTQASTDIRSVAVLPLQDLSGDPAQDYFADGMTDALITDLAQIKSLRVISRTSSMQFKSTKKSMPQIGRELGVDAIVEGTILRSGNNVRIDAQLIRASSDHHLWAQSYQRSMNDVVALQSEVATRVAREVEVHLTVQERARLGKSDTVNPTSYQSYLRGSFFFHKETDEGFAKAIEHYQTAITLDPHFAPAYVGLAETYGMMAYTRRIEPSEGWNKAKDFLDQALVLDHESSSAHTLAGMIKFLYHCDREGAQEELRQALDLNPGDMNALDYHSYYLLGIDRTDEAIAEKKQVLEHDPVSVGTNAELGLYYLNAHRYDEAIQQLERTLELEPNFPPALTRLAYAYAGKNQYQQAIAVLDKALSIDRTPRRLGFLAQTYVHAGKLNAALEILTQLQRLSEQRYVSPDVFAQVYALLGEKERAFGYLSKVRKEDGISLSDPALDSLRSDPRFTKLVARLKPEAECESF